MTRARAAVEGAALRACVWARAATTSGALRACVWARAAVTSAALRAWARTGTVGGERGSGTVAAVGVIAALLLATVGALAVVSAVLAAHRARAGADLAALAGATLVQEGVGPGPACAEARRIAAAQQVRVTGCTVDASSSVLVDTEMRPGLVLPDRGRSRPRGRARAGPQPEPIPAG